MMTNDPTWDWHLQNLNNYVALQPGWYGSQNADLEVPVTDAWYPWAHNAYDKEAPRVPQPIGHAYNTLGIPGMVRRQRASSAASTCEATATCTRRPPISTPR